MLVALVSDNFALTEHLPVPQLPKRRTLLTVGVHYLHVAVLLPQSPGGV